MGDFSRLYRAVKKSPTSIEFVKDNKYEYPNTADSILFQNALDFTHFFSSEYELTTGEGYEQENKSTDHRAVQRDHPDLAGRVFRL
jgi:hypothetical protein